jgi:hypothetical protein
MKTLEDVAYELGKLYCDSYTLVDYHHDATALLATWRDEAIEEAVGASQRVNQALIDSLNRVFAGEDAHAVAEAARDLLARHAKED